MSERRPEIREATKSDFPEILRLAHAMWTEMGLSPGHDVWERNAGSFFERGLTNNSLSAFVADNPGGSGLVACGVATVHQQLPAFWLPDGRLGFVQWFSTDPAWRRHGLATEILDRLIDWLDSLGVTRTHLYAADEQAISIYRKAGFEDTDYANLWLRR